MQRRCGNIVRSNGWPSWLWSFLLAGGSRPRLEMGSAVHGRTMPPNICFTPRNHHLVDFVIFKKTLASAERGAKHLFPTDIDVNLCQNLTLNIHFLDPQVDAKTRRNERGVNNQQPFFNFRRFSIFVGVHVYKLNFKDFRFRFPIFAPTKPFKQAFFDAANLNTSLLSHYPCPDTDAFDDG